MKKIYVYVSFLAGMMLFFGVLPVSAVSGKTASLPVEVTPTRLDLSLCGEWKFKDDSIEKEIGIPEKWYQPTYNDASWGSIKIPDPWWALKESRLRWYRKNFVLPASFKDKTIILRFMSATKVCKVWLNGHLLGEHTGGTVPFQFEVSRYINHTSPNLLVMRLYSKKLYFTEGGGMEGRIECLALPNTYIGKALIDTSYPGWFKAWLNIQKTDDDNEKTVLSYEIKEHKSGKIIKKGDVSELNLTTAINKHSFEADIENALPWAPECPNLYDIFLTLKNPEDGKMIDVWKDTIGFRKFEARGKNFYLNGRIFHPFGRSWGVAPKYGGKSRFKLLRNMGINLIRSHMGALRASYGPIMDEIGMMNEIEMAWPKGIMHSHKDVTGGKERAYSPELIKDFQELMEYYYNRPSTVMWSTGNERWNVPNKPTYGIPLCNELYDAAKAIDPYRPIINFEGSYSKSNGRSRALFHHVDKLKSDVATIHSYWGWYLGPVQTIAIDADYYRLNDIKKPLLVTECVGCYVASNASDWKKWLGEKRHKSRKWRNLCAARHSKETLEYQRMHPDIFAGACFLNDNVEAPNPKTLKRVYSPIFTCLDIDTKGKNYFSGTNIQVTLYLLNDYLYKEIKLADIELELVDSSGKRLFQWKKDVSLPITSFQKFPLKIKIPENISTGSYSINLFLKDGEKLLNDNSYNIFIMSRSDIPASIQTEKKVLVIEEEKNNEESNSISTILSELGVRHDKYDVQLAEKNIGKLKDYNVLIIGPDTIGDNDFFFEKGHYFKKFVAQGGRLLCLEQHSGIFMNWIPVHLSCKGSSSREFFGPTQSQNGFIDIKDFSHPIFKGISSIERFDTWNGDYGIIADTFLFCSGDVMQDAVLGAAGAPKRIRGDVILNFQHGDGEYLFSQLNAISRWKKDPVATRYIANMFDYIIEGSSAAAVLRRTKKESVNIAAGPFAPDKKGFIRHWLLCGPFPNPGGDKPLGFDHDYLLIKQGGFWVRGETEVEPVPGMKEEAVFPKEVDGHNWWGLGKDTRMELKWQKYASTWNCVDLKKVMPSSDNVAAYAACYISSPAEMDVKVKIGHNDGYKLWLNREFVGGSKECTGKPDSDIHNIKLKKGNNPVLLKITNAWGGWSYYLRFTDLDDKPLTDLKIWLIPNK